MKSKKSKIGFLPCFSNYNFNHFPVEDLYSNSTAVIKVKQLISAFIDSESPYSLSEKGIGKEIKPVRPNDSGDSKELIKLLSSPQYPIFRIDYGNTAFRIVFGLYNENNKKFAYILAFDMTHKTLPQRRRQRK